VLQCSSKKKNKIQHSSTTLFNEWQSTMLHVLILKESSSGSLYKNLSNTPLLQVFTLHFSEISLIYISKNIIDFSLFCSTCNINFSFKFFFLSYCCARRNISINPALVWWGITNPSHVFCYVIMVFGNNVFFCPVYLLLMYHRTQQLRVRRSGANNNGELQTFLSVGVSYTPPD